MGEKLKPNELPKGIERMVDDDGRVLPYAPLIVDNYLDRKEVVHRIAKRTGIDAPRAKHFNHDGLTRLAIALVDDLNGDVDDVRIANPKYRLIDLLGDAADFEVHGRQDDLIKSQLIHILLSLEADEPPDHFRVPTDPDMEKNMNDSYDRVPALSD